MFLAALSATVASSALADELPLPKAAYSADVAFEAKGKAYSGRIYVDGAKERREVKNASGVSSAVIIRRDQGRVYDLKPKRHLAVAMRMAAAEAAGETGTAGTDVDSLYGIDAAVEGKDTVGGLDATKYHFKIDGGPGLTVDSTVWATDDGIVVRVVGNTSVDPDSPPSKMELKNIVKGPQDPSLFELPPGMSILSAGGDSDTPESPAAANAPPAANAPSPAALPPAPNPAPAPDAKK
jgi:hypothetical protein